MLKIRRPLGRLIFNMGIAIPGKTVFLIETAPCCFAALELIQSVAHLYRSTYLDYYIIFPDHIQKRGKVEKRPGKYLLRWNSFFIYQMKTPSKAAMCNIKCLPQVLGSCFFLAFNVLSPGYAETKFMFVTGGFPQQRASNVKFCFFPLTLVWTNC